MNILLLTAVSTALLLFLYLFLIRTGKRHDPAEIHKLQELTGLCFAHRGLWSQEPSLPENSIAAFQAAIDKGFPIELDVHLTKDGHAVIFHDDNLKRMTGKDAMIWDCTYQDIKHLTLADSSETIPLFSDFLTLVDGKVPLLVELKGRDRSCRVAQVAAHLLESYTGVYCIESFSPFILRWYRKHRPSVLRGQLSCHFPQELKRSRLLLFLAEHLFMNWYSLPDFIAYEKKQGMSLPAIRLIRLFYKAPIFAWTIRDPAEFKKVSGFYDSIIFDRWNPPSAVYQKSLRR